jgi:hypothetical protein
MAGIFQPKPRIFPPNQTIFDRCCVLAPPDV